ncbi:hypothetical protein [Streptomyces sp. NPDC001851]|uniref:hypothetical protein n=1 Tax=Streptomyces sp. NPDC001851 TaxID=3154529 RepID=UPI0033334B3D
MTYFMYDTTGEEIDEPGEEQIRAILAELGNGDEEHPDVSLQHESGWSLTVFPGRLVRWQNVDSASPEPLDAILPSWDAVVGLLLLTARGETEPVTSRLSQQGPDPTGRPVTS